jgi:peptidyl-prolyl cis-trans isomerase SurA
MKKIILIIAMIAMLIPGVGRAENFEIAAIVNDEVISKLDIAQRLALISISTNLDNDPQSRQKIIPQVLRGLIDEKLQTQEAKRLNIVVTENELMAAIARVAAQNNIPSDQFEQYITSKGGSYDSLLDQIRATIAWTRAIRQKFASTTRITEEEINDEIAKAIGDKTQNQYLAAEIFLAVDNPADEASIKQTADRILQEILGGAPFAPLARQFSQNSSAASGGDLGWVKRGQLDPVLDQRLATMSENQISKPIRTEDGFHILMLREIKTGDQITVGQEQRDAIANGLRQRKLDSAARRYLRDLRSQSIVDMRG